MENTIDYSGAPNGFALCSSTVCGKADCCLRRLAFEAASHEKPFFYMVNPYLAEQSTKGCKHFTEAKKVRYARGFVKLTRVLPVGVASTFRNNLISFFGRKKYYHYRRGLKLIPPTAQAHIVDTVKQLGVQVDDCFDSYEEYLNW